MALVVAMGAAVLVLHTHITRTFPPTTAVPSPLPASGAAVSPTALAKPDVKPEEAEVTSHPAAPSDAGGIVVPCLSSLDLTVPDSYRPGHQGRTPYPC